MRFDADSWTACKLESSASPRCSPSRFYRRGSVNQPRRVSLDSARIPAPRVTTLLRDVNSASFQVHLPRGRRAKKPTSNPINRIADQPLCKRVVPRRAAPRRAVDNAGNLKCARNPSATWPAIDQSKRNIARPLHTRCPGGSTAIGPPANADSIPTVRVQWIAMPR